MDEGNRTSDQDINRLSVIEQRVVVTKDADFVNSFYLFGQPWKLLLISTGNTRNDELAALFCENTKRLEAGFTEFGFIELTRDRLIYHA